MALKQRHRTAEMTRNDIKIGQNCDSDKTNSDSDKLVLRLFCDHQMRKRFLLQMVWWINKQKHSITNVSIFRVISFQAFWKFFWLGNSAWDFLGVKFWSRDFFGFDFCLHWIIPVTWNPEYPHGIEVWQHRAVL